MSYPYTVTVGGTDYTLKVPWESLTLEMTGTAEQCVAEFSILDKTNSVSISDGATVTIDDNLEGLRNFTGLVTTNTPKIAGVGRIITIRAVDLGSLLDIRLVPFDERAAESDKARLTYLMQTYGAGLTADYTQIATTNASLPSQSFTNMTLRAAIETVCSIASATTRYWVDAYGRLCTASSFTTTAPYAIVTRPDPPPGSIAPEDLAITRDSSGICNAYYVRGKTEAGSGWVTDASSISTYGRRAQYVDAPDADTGTKRDAVGNAYLTDTKDPIYRGTFSTYSDYDGWRPCQVVTVTSPQLDQDGAAFRILRVSKRWTNGTGARHYDCEFGGTGFRFSLLSGQLMPSPQALLGGTVTGAFGGGTGVSLPSNAGVYATRQGIAVTGYNSNGSNTMERVRLGILPNGDYGLGLFDEFGTTLVTQSGFGAAWLDLIRSGIYNNMFALAASGGLDYYDALMALSPTGYWRLGEPSGTTAYDISTNAHNGTYLGGTTYGATGALTNDPNTCVTWPGNVTQGVNITDTVMSTTGSIAAWFKRTRTSANEYIMWGTSTGPALVFINTDNYLYLRKTGVGMMARSSVAITDTAWHFAVGVWDGTAAGRKIYLDGVDVTYTTGLTETSPAATPASIGADPTGASNRFAGSIDEVATFPAALTQANVTTLYTAARTGHVVLPVGTNRDDAVGRTSSLPFWTIWRASGTGSAGLVQSPSWPGDRYVSLACAAVGTASTNNIVATSDPFPVLPSMQYRLHQIRRIPMVAGTVNCDRALLFYDGTGAYISTTTLSAGTSSPIALGMSGTDPFMAPANARSARLETTIYETVAHNSANRFNIGAAMVTCDGNGYGDFYYSVHALGDVRSDQNIHGESVQSKAKAGTISDTDFTVTPADGAYAVDTTNHRLYFREGGGWHYCARTAGFEVPKDETECPICKESLKAGDDVAGTMNDIYTDGAAHGVWIHLRCARPENHPPVGRNKDGVALARRVTP